MSKWISVKDRFPEPRQNILVFDTTGRQHISVVFDQWTKQFVEHVEITHWMPLPEPPEGE